MTLGIMSFLHLSPSDWLTLINVGGGRNHPPPLENRVFSATEHHMNPRLVCKFEFCLCGRVEKKLERSICLSLVVAARQNRLGSKYSNPKILNFLLLPQNFTTNQGLHSKFSHPTPRTAYQCANVKKMR